MKVVAIVGSPRPKGNTNYLVDQALQEILKHGIETEKIILSQYRINGCLGHENCRSSKVCQQDDDGRWIVERFSQADGIILATPVYYYNMTAQMKTFIDRNYFLYMHGIRLNAVCAGVIVVAGGSAIDITMRALRRCFRIKGENWEERVFTLTGYASRPGEVKNQPALIEEARNLGRKMVEVMNSVSQP